MELVWDHPCSGKWVNNLFAEADARPQTPRVAGASREPREPASFRPFLLWPRTSPFCSSFACASIVAGLGLLSTLGTSEPAARGGVNKPVEVSSTLPSTSSDDVGFNKAGARRHCKQRPTINTAPDTQVRVRHTL